MNCKAERMVQNNPEKYVATIENTEIKLEVDPIKLDADELEFLICYEKPLVHHSFLASLVHHSFL